MTSVEVVFCIIPTKNILFNCLNFSRKTTVSFLIPAINSRCGFAVLSVEFDIQLEPGFFPNPDVLPRTFSKGVVKLLAEQQRAYNCASWYLMYFLVKGQAQELPTTKSSHGYPYNLIKAVYDEVDRADKHPNLIPPEEIEGLLCTLHPFEEDLLLLLFKRDLTVDAVLNTMSLPFTDVVRWGFEELLGRIKRNALLRLYYNYSKCLSGC